MKRFLLKILFKLRPAHKHRWTTTSVNAYQIPIRQVCTCGLARKARSNPQPATIAGMDWPRLEWRWEYSDGTRGEWQRMGSFEDFC